MAGRTDQIVRAVAEEAEKRRPLLDGPDPPQNVAVVIYLDRGGKPVRVLFEPKWSRELGERGNGR